ncbi:MAG: STAS domain-containing protein [Chloroflexi bacterium]|nr:STAS domain-containing protein [Chloroflexota bacterium]
MSESQNNGLHSTLALSGRIDASNSHKLERDLLALHEQQPGMLIVDLSDVTYISSSGLRVLLMAHRRQQCQGGQLFLRNPSPKIMHIMTLCGFDQVFAFV